MAFEEKINIYSLRHSSVVVDLEDQHFVLRCIDQNFHLGTHKGSIFKTVQLSMSREEVKAPLIEW